MIADILTTNYGSIVALRPTTFYGRQWIADNVDADMLDDGIDVWCDARYAVDIMIGALRAGLTLEDTATGHKSTRHDVARIEASL